MQLGVGAVSLLLRSLQIAGTIIWTSCDVKVFEGEAYIEEETRSVERANHDVPIWSVSEKARIQFGSGRFTMISIVDDEFGLVEMSGDDQTAPKSKMCVTI